VLFKVGCVKDQSNRFDQSFRVKKICTDDSIIQIFSNGGSESSVCIFYFILLYFVFHFISKRIIYIFYFNFYVVKELQSQKKRLFNIKDVEQDHSSVEVPQVFYI